MKQLFIRILKQIKNDKRSIVLVFLAPILVLFFLYFLLGDSNYKPIFAVKNLPSQIVTNLEKNDASVVSFPSNREINDYLNRKEADAVIDMDNSGIKIKMLKNDNVKVSLILEKVKKALKQTNPSASINMAFVYGKASANIFNSLAYVLLGVISFFFVFF